MMIYCHYLNNVVNLKRQYIYCTQSIISDRLTKQARKSLMESRNLFLMLNIAAPRF